MARWIEGQMNKLQRTESDMVIEEMREAAAKPGSLYSLPPPVAKVADQVRANENCSTRIYSQKVRKSTSFYDIPSTILRNTISRLNNYIPQHAHQKHNLA